MLKRLILFLLSFFLFWMLLFSAVKWLFLCYNRVEYAWSTSDLFDVLLHGWSMDASTAGYLMVVLWLMALLMWLRPAKLWQRIAVGYAALAAVLVGLIVMVDAFLYPFWKFKLSATIFTYM